MADATETETLEQKIIRFRDAAENVRSLALNEHGSDYRKSMMLIAESWDRLAEMAERDVDYRDYKSRK